MNTEFLRNFFKKEWKIPFEEKVMRVIQSFSLTEKVVFFFFVVVFLGSGLSLLWQVNNLFLVSVPDYGGSLTEGVVGSPRFVNPLLAISDTDKDMVSLVYSGLLKATPEGTLIPDLAESFTISPDGLTYTFVLKDTAYFQDGTKVTSDDVVFTIEKAEDNVIKSPRKANWDGVKVEKVDEKTVRFTLKQPYSPFIQNTTLGILPKHIWKTATSEEFAFSQLNINPVGSGPYKVNSIIYSGSGIPKEYHLTAFKKYALGRPFITTLVIKAFQNEKDMISAYKSGGIESMHSISLDALSTLKIEKGGMITSPLPRIFGLFFNQNVAPVFVNREVREALSKAVDKKEIIQTVLQNFGQEISGPIPPTMIDSESEGTSTAQQNTNDAIQILTSNGWKLNSSGVMEKKDKKGNVTTLKFSISTSDAPELKFTAELLQKQWQKIGAQVEVKIFEIGDLNQNIIRPRKYDSLLFGEVIGRDMDLYPFWHSSARVDPGLNIATYANIKVDKILETIRDTAEPSAQKPLYDSLTQEINADIPAVFIYSPYFTYIVPTKVHNISVGSLTSPNDRFNDIYKWYTETNKVWKIFAH